MIDLYEQNKFLWDPRHSDYFKRDKKEVCLSKFIEALGPEFTVREIKRKWKNMRDVFIRRHKAYEARLRSGATPEELEKMYSKGDFFKRLKFLLDCNMENNSNLECMAIQGDAYKIEDWSTVSANGVLEQVEDSTEGLQMASPSSSSSHCYTPILEEEFKGQKITSVDIARDVLLLKAAKCFGNDEPNDEHTYFGKFVACTLRSMHPQKRHLVQLKIHEVLFNAQQDNC